MISFPHSKINLGLSVVSKRPDGFHNLETIFYPLPVCDVLEIISSEETVFFQSGSAIPGTTRDNLVLRAYHLLKEKYTQIGPLEIHLHKAIPLGAGMGGGSSDAAETVLLLNRFFKLEISSGELLEYALKLGSDCPFFVQNSPCYATGRGEILEPLDLDLSGYSFLLIHPEISINTVWAFSHITPAQPVYQIKNSISQPIQSWPETLHNDFEKVVFEVYPFLEKIKMKLYSAGALYAAMTGSGSSIFGIFSKSAIPKIIFEDAKQTFIR